MKNNMLILVIFVFSGIFVNAQENLLDKPFYYYKGEKFYLDVDYSRITVISEGKFNTKIETKAAFNVKNEYKNYTKQIIVSLDKNAERLQNKEIFITEIEFSEALNQSDYKDVILQFSKSDNVIEVTPAYASSEQKFGISNNFCVKLLREEDRNKLFELANKYSIKVLGYNEFMPLWFTLSCDRESSLNSMEAANLFYETDLFESSEPEFLYHDLLASNDQYFSNQWGLENTGQYCNTSDIDINIENAWSITTGAPNIRVAVFDNGIQMNHPDLINNIYGTGYDAETNTTPSVLRNGNHGTPCAGIISATQNNSVVISGVAPNSKLVSISLGFSSSTPQQFANGFNWAWHNGADVISNSWGGNVPSNIIDDAITNAQLQGRNGLGCVVVFCTHNQSGPVVYPASLPNVIGVGAISPDGKRKTPIASCDGEYWWGSNYGDGLDVMAPGVLIPTTTHTGGYTQDFGGTSCPYVSGIVALILSVNPNLTAQQVRNIIEQTAQKVGGYNYTNSTAHPNGTWNNEMGHGLVDAYAAVKMALCALPASTLSKVITTDETINSSILQIYNTTVKQNKKLTANACEEVNINANFEVEAGAEFEINITP